MEEDSISASNPEINFSQVPSTQDIVKNIDNFIAEKSVMDDNEEKGNLDNVCKSSQLGSTEKAREPVLIGQEIGKEKGLNVEETVDRNNTSDCAKNDSKHIDEVKTQTCANNDNNSDDNNIQKNTNECAPKIESTTDELKRTNSDSDFINDTSLDAMIKNISENADNCKRIFESLNDEHLAKKQKLDENSDDVRESSKNINVSGKMTLLAEACQEFTHFLKGCKWSPDGNYVLTNSDDNILRIFQTSEELLNGSGDAPNKLQSVQSKQEGDGVYDYQWYPKLNEGHRFVASSKDGPVHMWDALTGELSCTYRAYDQNDELTSALSLAFNPDGNKLYCGFNKTIRVFDVSKPGRDCKHRKTFNKEGQSGIISCIAVNPDLPKVYAAGSYSRTVALYSEPSGSMICMFEGQAGGVTHLQFSPDGSKLFTGGRKDPEILCWDLRSPGKILFTMMRKVKTNQRIYFDIDKSGRYLVSGNHDGTISFWDTLQTPDTSVPEPCLDPILTESTHRDAVNGVSFHPSLPVLASSSGQRHYVSRDSSSDEDNNDHEKSIVDNSMKIWKLNNLL